MGGVIAQIALAQHRDAFDKTKPYLALQRNAERTFVAQAGLLGEGMPARQIAKTLHVSVKTVEAHREHIKAKLNFKTSSELLRYAIQSGSS